MPKSQSFLDRVRGAALGGAIGDALGFVAEKAPRHNASAYALELRLTGIPKTLTQRTWPRPYQFGQYSDDTQFAMILIQSIVESGGLNGGDFLDRLALSHKQGRLVGIGGGTRKLLEAHLADEDTKELSKLSSNGSVMRVWPIGIYAKDETVAKILATRQSEISHGSEEALRACRAVALAVFWAARGDHKTAAQKLPDLLRSVKVDPGFLEYGKIQFETYMRQNYAEHMVDGWEMVPPGAMATMEAALWVYRHFGHDFDLAVTEAISLGGDTDSLASIVGALTGASVGLSGIPGKYRGLVYDEARDGGGGEDFVIAAADLLTKVSRR